MDHKICPSCKEKNNPNFLKCWKCGYSFQTSSGRPVSSGASERNSRGQIKADVKSIGKVLVMAAILPDKQFDSIYPPTGSDAERRWFEYVLIRLWIAQGVVPTMEEYKTNDRWKKILDSMMYCLIEIIEKDKTWPILESFCMNNVSDFLKIVLAKRWSIYSDEYNQRLPDVGGALFSLSATFDAVLRSKLDLSDLEKQREASSANLEQCLAISAVLGARMGAKLGVPAIIRNYEITDLDS